MNLTQARELTAKYLTPFLVQNNFTVKLNRNKEATIERKTARGIDSMNIRLLNYNPSYQITYGFRKTNDQINSIMLQLQDRVKLQFEYDRKSHFVFFSYNTINDPKNTAYLPF